MKQTPNDLAAVWGAGLRVVLVHDWLTGMRGGERVLELFCEAFPSAPILTLVHNRPAISAIINGHAVRTSSLQRIPGIHTRYRHFLPCFPSAIEHMRVPDADLVISISHCVAKGIVPPPGARHLCYCLTPMRYAWTFYEEYFGTNPLKKLVLKPILAALRRWDRRVCSRVDRFVAISRTVRGRIGAAYGRDADVVHPPVDTDRWTPDPAVPRADYDLIVSALVPYKRIDLAIQAYSRLGRRLRIVGVGSEMNRLRAAAPSNVEFLGWQSDADILRHYRECRLLVFPGEEDFGLVPVEAQACGTPVVAYARGGATETVEDGVSGRFFTDPTAESLADAVRQAVSHPWDGDAIRRHAERFAIGRFQAEMNRSIQACMAGPRTRA